jgi:hypothetical protein
MDADWERGSAETSGQDLETFAKYVLSFSREGSFRE